jgi:signal transduction histidine kinase
VLAALESPVYVVTPDLQIEPINAAAERVERNSNGDDLLSAQLIKRARQALDGVADGPPERPHDLLVCHLNNEPRFFLPKALDLRNERGRTIGVAIVMEDVTQFRLMDELKSNFFSTVSHEIKTPLTSVRMAVHMLQADMLGPLLPPQAALITTAREDIERLLRLLNNLLDLARFDQGATQMDLETTRVRDFVREAVEEVRTLVAAQKLTVQVECPDGLPDLRIDRARINHVLRNLLTNAIKHSPEGGEIRLTVSMAESGSVQFAVRDLGPGIPAEHIGRIFDRFYRVPGQKIHGSGLGLSIAREIILGHHGTITCASEPGRQTTFYFTLPAAPHVDRGLAANGSGASIAR